MSHILRTPRKRILSAWQRKLNSFTLGWRISAICSTLHNNLYLCFHWSYQMSVRHFTAIVALSAVNLKKKSSIKGLPVNCPGWDLNANADSYNVTVCWKEILIDNYFVAALLLPSCTLLHLKSLYKSVWMMLPQSFPYLSKQKTVFVSYQYKNVFQALLYKEMGTITPEVHPLRYVLLLRKSPFFSKVITRKICPPAVVKRASLRIPQIYFMSCYFSWN